MPFLWSIAKRLCEVPQKLRQRFCRTFLQNPKGSAEFWGTFGSPDLSFKDRLLSSQIRGRGWKATDLNTRESLGLLLGPSADLVVKRQDLKLPTLRTPRRPYLLQPCRVQGNCPMHFSVAKRWLEGMFSSGEGALIIPPKPKYYKKTSLQK